MYFDFRPLLRRTFANIREHIPIHRPRPSAGGVLKEKGTPGALVIGSRKASLLETWLLRLELVSRDFKKHHQGVTAAGARMCFRTMVLGCREASPLEARLLAMRGKVIAQKHHQPHRELNQNQTEILWCPSPAGARAAVGGSPLYYDYNIQLSRNFRDNKCYFRELEKHFREGF